MADLIKKYRSWTIKRRLRREASYLLGETRRIIDILAGSESLPESLAPTIWFRIKKWLKIILTLGLSLAFATWYRRRHHLSEEQIASLDSAVSKLQRALEKGRTKKITQALEELDRALDSEVRHARKSTIREYAESLGLAVFVALLLRAFVVEAFEIPSGSMLPTLEIGDHIFVNKFAYGLRVPFTKHPPRKFFHWGRPKRGEVIVFINNKNVDHDFIKRVIAVGGDEVKVEDGIIFLKRGGKGPWKPVTRRRLKSACRYQDLEGSNWVVREDCDFWLETLGGHSYRTIVDRDRENRDYPPMDLYEAASLPIGSLRLSALQFYNPYKVPKNHYFVMGDNRTNSGDSRYPNEVGFVPLDFVKGKALVVWSSWGPHVRWSRIGHVIR